MTADHLRPLLDNEQDSHRLFRMGEKLCQVLTPPSINATIRMGRLTALQKLRGGVRGIVVGDIVRRLVSRTMAEQLRKVVERCTTKAGTECIAHALQTLTELDPQATVVSIDGVGAYDTISRKAMLEALARMPDGRQRCQLCDFSMGNLPNICGRMQKALCTQLHKERGESKGTPSCPCSSL